MRGDQADKLRRIENRQPGSQAGVPMRGKNGPYVSPPARASRLRRGTETDVSMQARYIDTREKYLASNRYIPLLKPKPRRHCPGPMTRAPSPTHGHPRGARAASGRCGSGRTCTATARCGRAAAGRGSCLGGIVYTYREGHVPRGPSSPRAPSEPVPPPLTPPPLAQVCLSLLGTWHGEPWDPRSSTLLQVTVHRRSLSLSLSLSLSFSLSLSLTLSLFLSLSFSLSHFCPLRVSI